MSEVLDKVRGVRELPLFPLPLVLFPGVPLPLHVFEPRYRRMLADVRAGNNLFGVSYFDASTAPGRDRPPVGQVGCAAEVVEVQPLSDGRSNVLTVGLVRYRVDSYLVRGDSYLVGEVSFFEDEAEDEGLLRQSAGEVKELFMRIARAVRTISGEREALPELPDTEPERFSFLVAAAMELDAEVKQELLELESCGERLRRLRDLLVLAVDNYEERARVHAVAKRNGHGGKKLDFDE
ncbi:MAG: LON peptidase substrate-binding domain-containing protein [Acidobacteriota bacterium]|nr:LON peptidase substrate-binding domain-containing protein [Acidobacteriota bacterium]